MIWLLPTPHPRRNLDRRHTGKRKRDNLLRKKKEGEGEEPDQATARKPGPL
jgi:hypothetical protein